MRHDNMRRGPVTLNNVTFQRTDGPIRGPAPFPVLPDRVVAITMPKNGRVGGDEIRKALDERTEQYGDPY